MNTVTTATTTNGFNINLRRLINTKIKYHLDEVTDLVRNEALLLLERNGVDIRDPDGIPAHVFEENAELIVTHFFGKGSYKE